MSKDSGGDGSDDSALVRLMNNESNSITDSKISSNGSMKRSSRSAAELQKKLERCIEQAKKNQNSTPIVDQPYKKSTGIIPLNRIPVPSKSNHLRKGSDSSDMVRTPLVLWESETSEDEYEFQPAITSITMNVNDEGKPEKLISKASYKKRRTESFDISDEDDLDLIPPRPLNERTLCCPMRYGWCSLQ